MYLPIIHLQTSFTSANIRISAINKVCSFLGMQEDGGEGVKH